MSHAGPQLPRRSAIWLATLILLLGFGLRIHRLGLDSIWWDEGYAVWMARMPVREMLFQTANDNAPPLSYAFLHYWRLLAGDEELALRLPSALSGLLTVAISYQIGREVGGRGAGLAGLLAAAVARFTVWWSQEIRLYPYSALFAALTIWASIRLFGEKPGTWRWAAIIAASMAGGLLTVYLFGAPVIVLNAAFIPAFFAVSRRWRLLLAWGIAQAIALIIFLPWWLYATRYIPTWVTPQEALTFGDTLFLYIGVLTLGIPANIERYLLPATLIGMAILVGAVIAFMNSQRRQRIGWAVLICSLILSPLLIYLLSIPRGQFNAPIPTPRYFLPLAAPVYVLLGWGAVEINHRLRHVGSVMLAGITALSLWSLGQYYSGLRLADDYGSLVATLEALRAENDAVLLNNDTDWPIFTYHYPYAYDRHITHTQMIGDEKYAADLLEPYRGRADAVWLVQTQYAGVTDPDNHILQWLESKSWHTQEYDFGSIQLWYFALTQARADRSRLGLSEGVPRSLQSVDALVADGVRLVGYTQAIPEIQAGDRLTIGLLWRIDERQKGEWPIALKIIGPGGQEYASALVPLVARRGLTGERWQLAHLFIPPDTPGGRAQIVFVAGQTWRPLGSIRIIKRQLTQTVSIPARATHFDVRFGDSITLVAASLPERSNWSPGEDIPLTFYWQAQTPIAERYKVFVHIVGDEYNPANDSFIWGQQDQEPGGGTMPTTAWIPGMLIEDSYLVTVREEAPPGRYQLRVGFYLPLDGLRLPVFGSESEGPGDSLVVFEIELE